MADYKALYRKWRPVDFDDVCGQNRITDILKYEVATDKTSHAYLFCGSRGTGKTTCAKLLAKAVNCLSPVNGSPCGKCEACLAIDSGTTSDVLEMDAASISITSVAMPESIALHASHSLQGLPFLLFKQFTAFARIFAQVVLPVPLEPQNR